MTIAITMFGLVVASHVTLCYVGWLLAVSRESQPTAARCGRCGRFVRPMRRKAFATFVAAIRSAL